MVSSNFHLNGLFQETAIYIESDGVTIEDQNSSCPLSRWNKAVSELTRIDAKKEIRQPYTQLILSLGAQLTN